MARSSSDRDERKTHEASSCYALALVAVCIVAATSVAAIVFVLPAKNTSPAGVAADYTSWWYRDSADAVSVRCEEQKQGEQISCTPFNKSSGESLGICVYTVKNGELWADFGTEPIKKPYQAPGDISNPGPIGVACY